MLFFIIFLSITLIEISLFITIGEKIGLGATLGLTFGTAVIGSFILRQQGIKMFFDAQTQLSQGSFPLKELFDAFCLAIAGATLITPGFLTDFIGFLLLFQPFRDLLRAGLPKLFKLDLYQDQMSADFSSKPEPHIIDVEYERLDDEDEA